MKPMVFVGMMAMLVACSSNEEQFEPTGTVASVQFRGAAVADEPEAALVGREMLMVNGNAIDSVVAMSMVLSVTLPSQVGLASSGMCVVRSAFFERNAVMDMIALRPANAVVGDRPAAVPTFVRGLFALHSRHGSTAWNKVVAPAEKMARFGVPVSRALARDLERVGPALLADPGARKIFGKPDGTRVKREGEIMFNEALSEVLFELRLRGLTGIYNKAFLERWAAGGLAAGGGWTPEILANAKPRWRPPIQVRTADFFGNVLFTPPPAAASLTAAQIWGMMTYDDLNVLDGVSAEEIYPIGQQLLVTAAGHAYSDRARWENSDGSSKFDPQGLVSRDYLGEMIDDFDVDEPLRIADLDPQPKADFANPAGTIVAAVDRGGSAAACFFTMNNLFGTGRIAGDTGILMPAAPGPGGRGPQGLVAMIAVDENRNGIYFAGGASGGVAAPTALVQTAIPPLLGLNTVTGSQKRARIHYGGNPDTVFYERGLEPELVQSLEQRGYETKPVDSLGRVSAIICSDGIPSSPGTCGVGSDPRGLGFGASANW